MTGWKYTIEIDGEDVWQDRGLGNIYAYLFGFIRGLSNSGWIKLKEVKKDPQTYKVTIMRDDPIITKFSEYTIIVKKVKVGDEDGQ